MTADELERLIDEQTERENHSVVHVATAFLERIERWQPRINAFITVTPDLALADASQVDEARKQGGETGLLDGLIVSIKDDIDVGRVRCTVGSRFHADRVAAEDAEVVKRLRKEGAVVVGKAGLHEWAFGATSDNPHYGTIRNPWDTTRVPGGSSGGSGAAVSADLCMGSIGSDAGGSVRIPAALCGVSGLRPTLGSVSGLGSHPICYSVETLGPLARSVRDIALMLAAVAEPDPQSGDGVAKAMLTTLEDGIEGMRVGLLGGFFFDGVDPDVDRAVRSGVDTLVELGAEVSDIVLAGAEEAYAATANVIVRAEAFAIQEERLAHQPALFGDDVRRRLELGRDIRGADYARATERLRTWRRDVSTAFLDYDLLVAPTTLDPAPVIEGSEMIATTHRLARLTYPLSPTGAPALSVPCGLTGSGLPIGVQLVAAPGRDDLVLRAGVAYQTRTDWHRLRPPEAIPETG